MFKYSVISSTRCIALLLHIIQNAIKNKSNKTKNEGKKQINSLCDVYFEGVIMFACIFHLSDGKHCFPLLQFHLHEK